MIPALYIKLGIAAVLLGVGFAAGTGWQKSSTAKVKQEFAEFRAEQARLNADTRQAALDAERAATAREHDLQSKIDTLDKEARHAETARTAARADADRAAERLRIALDALKHSARDASGAAAATAGQCAPADSTHGVLAELHQRADDRAGAVSSFADAAHAAGQQCQVMYEAARASLTGK